MDHKHPEELLEAYALGVLEQDQRSMVERHLAGCADCRRRADDLSGTIDLLPLALAAASPLRPPTDLKDRVLGAVEAAARPLPPPVADARELAGSPTRISNTSSAPTRWSVLSGRTGGWRTVAAAAAGVLMVLSLAWSARLSEALDQERALREQVSAHFMRQQEIVLEVVDADEATRAILRSPDPDSRAYGKLFTRPDLPHVVAMAARLPIPAEGQNYHLWLTSEGRTFLAGVLPVNNDGFALLTFDAEHDGPVYEAAQLTLQAVGAEIPGGEIALAWSE